MRVSSKGINNEMEQPPSFSVCRCREEATETAPNSKMAPVKRVDDLGMVVFYFFICRLCPAMFQGGHVSHKMCRTYCHNRATKSLPIGRELGARR
mmetsp:Transcript_97958/g.146932  ORF Transcript_97958/g.146932 Transcript_97958/m.146932 type:complete len:95 (+) Transcript_97958:520-804(+)